MIELDFKKMNLINTISSYDSVAVAFSSGVDSTFLLMVCKQVLGDRVIAITANSSALPSRELKESIDFCKQNGIKQIVFDASKLNRDIFLQNPKDRCYHCKKAIFSEIIKIANQNGVETIFEGSNLDDDNDYRPGAKAIKELGIISPLHMADLTKQDIRDLSKQYELSTATKPSFACLATRFLYGQSITEEKLKMVDKAEQLLFDLGFEQFRVRVHNDLARIEVNPNELEKLASMAENVDSWMKQIGFTYVTMDLAGYQMGSMNKTM